MEKFRVEVPSVAAGGYDVLIGSGILTGELLDSLVGGRRAVLVSDDNVFAAGILEPLLTYEGQKFIISPAGEKSKHIGTIVSIVESMEAASMARDSVVIAVGGGTVGDMAGFAAAIYKRGVDVIHIPTTTVSQADSSIGGKTGVDSTKSKNAYGCFWQPAAVVIDVKTLKSLDQRQYCAGLVESLKHALIADKEYFEFFEANVENLLNRSEEALCSLASWNCRIKASIVAQDPTEKNLRRILNYGHTIGHAVETLSGYDLLHGECVAIGIIAASLIEQRLELGTKQRTERIKKLLLSLSQPVSIPEQFDCDRLLEVVSRDKKVIAGAPRFALLEELGKAYQNDGQWAHPVDAKIVKDVINQLYGQQ